MTEEDKKIEILVVMESSVIKASQLARDYDFALDLKSSLIFIMKLWKEFNGNEHPIAKDLRI